MKNIKGYFIMPHPPIIIPEIGKDEVKKAQNTYDAMQKAARDIAGIAPETIIVLTPHANMIKEIGMSLCRSFTGDLNQFRAKDVFISFENDIPLTQLIMNLAADNHFKIREFRSIDSRMKLDHGATVPLSFIHEQYPQSKLVYIGVPSGLSVRKMYELGELIAIAAGLCSVRSVILASGDLSHKLLEDGPYGYVPEGPAFDSILNESIKNNDVDALLSIDPMLAAAAGECGYRPISALFGAINQNVNVNLYSYEGPFGVGYCIFSILPVALEGDEYTALARNALETYIKTKKTIIPSSDLPFDMLNKRAGAFVSIKKLGSLRGCIGTISPTKESIAAEIISMAIEAGAADPRFKPVQESELDDLTYSVDILGAASPAEREELDVHKYGIIVSKGYKRGLLLPNLEGVDTVDFQIGIALSKAGIDPNESYTLEKFEVERHSEI